MTTSTGNFVCDNSSLANFKNWAQAISNAISGFGWTQTTDTGQVNWGSIASVPSSTYVYEVWKANDAAAATMPIYLKVEYGFSSTQINLRMTVGTSSNGSGTITGQVVSGAPWQITNTWSNQGATTFPCYFSGSAGEFRMYMWSVTGASPAIGTVFGVERSKDGSGNDTNGYVTVFSANQSNFSFCFQQTIKSSGVGLRDQPIVGLGLTSTSNTGQAFGTVAAFPVFPILGVVGNPMLGLMTGFANDIANGSTNTVASMYGSTHTYIGFSGGIFNTCLGQRANNGATIAGLMRYE